MIEKDTIIALATPAGSGAISVIRISGLKSIRQTSACPVLPEHTDSYVGFLTCPPVFSSPVIKKFSSSVTAQS